MYAKTKTRMKIKPFFLVAMLIGFASCSAQQPKTNDSTNTKTIQIKDTMSTEYNKLTEWEKQVILNKATDRPFTGDYYQKKDKGVYICRQCNAHLYNSDDKFDSHCGWPSFDDEVKGAVTRVRDADGYRVEIICNNCKGHLGHVFEGEGFTDKDTRHCVNTSSILFIPAGETIPKVIVKSK